MSAPFNRNSLLCAREVLRLSRTQLARKVGITPRQIMDWEFGLYVPDAAMVTRLSVALRVPESLFFAVFEFRQLPLTFYYHHGVAFL